MAWLEKRQDAYSLSFRWQGKKYKASLGTMSDTQAQRQLAMAEQTLADIKRGRLIVPDKVDIGLFVLSDGRAGKIEDRPPELMLHAMLDAMLADTPTSAWAETSWRTLELHVRNLKRCITNVPITAVDRGVLQKYIGTRSKEDTHPEGPTIRKEIETLRAIWNRYVSKKTAEFPRMKLLDFPKSEGKPWFQCWEKCEESGCWDSLYLSVSETAEFLKYMEGRGPDWLHPMLVLACHTGARRSELCRALPQDVDLEGQWWVVREKKRDKSKKETRRKVDLSNTATAVLKAWIDKRDKTSPTIFGIEPITASHRLTDHAKGKWQPCGKWHMHRHSFASNLAIAGVDQRIIDSYMGHMTPEMRERYQHLAPSSKRAALTAVYA